MNVKPSRSSKLLRGKHLRKYIFNFNIFRIPLPRAWLRVLCLATLNVVVSFQFHNDGYLLENYETEVVKKYIFRLV